MSRWTQYTEDSERLPTGMKRIGYDADTQRYTFQDSNGVLYESEPGNAYGKLRPVVRDCDSDIRRTRPNAFESPRKPTSTGSSHSRSTSTPTSNLHSFQDFLPPTAITSSPPPPNSHNRTNSSSSDIFSKVKSMTSIISRFQLSPNKPREGGRYQHIKSSSLPLSSLSGLERFPTPQSQMSPPRRSRDHASSRRGAEEDELKKRLLRSKTTVTRSSAITPPSSSSTPGSKYRSSVHRSTSISPSPSSSYPRRTSSQASRISNISTTSTITPMKTT